MITLIVMTDGRGGYLRRSMDSIETMLDAPIATRVLHDDSGDASFARWLASEYGDRWRIVSTPRRSGFAGAYRSAWAWIREHCRDEWVFSTEDDFVIERPIDVEAMRSVMRTRGHLTQMALRRQAWSPAEIDAGGMIERFDRDDFAEYVTPGARAAWLEHRLFWTTNPSLFRRELVESREWPSGANSEGRFGVSLFADDAAARSGIWGARDSGAWVRHIGAARAGAGY